MHIGSRSARHSRRRRPRVPAAIKAAAAFLCVCLLIGLNDARMLSRQPAPEPSSAPTAAPESTPYEPSSGRAAGAPAPKAIDTPDISISVFNTATGSIETLELEEYLCGVLSAEMPASYEPDALRAQAVCARTLVLQKARRFGGGGCASRPQADVCTSYLCCQAYDSPDAQRARFGNNYAKYAARLREAVDQTRGWIVAYGGAPIQMLYHSTSGGQTEDAAHVFSQNLPYLKSVQSPGEEAAPKYDSQVSLTREKFAQLCAKAAGLDSLDPKRVHELVSVDSRYDSGRVETLRIGEKSISGVKARQALGLNSANFRLEFGESDVVILVRGSGHGVGMSQVGANAMAKAGYTWPQIISHYYTGVSLASLLDFIEE